MPAVSDGGKTAAYKSSAKTSMPAGNTLDRGERRGTRRQKSAAQYPYTYGSAAAVPNMTVKTDRPRKGLALLYYKSINAVNKFFAELGSLF
ncbi:MAG: hypothetical protein FWB85_09030 [Chitinispirillia bacterium]|nr:hypothetical protein [Chitinispirillia bacterium]MCL2242786.1 hypothetical protein [Chitinispirillia bacterium]